MKRKSPLCASRRVLRPAASGTCWLYRRSATRCARHFSRFPTASPSQNRVPVRSRAPLYDHPVDLKSKPASLADAAKYDASCASSGGDKRDSVGGRGLGSNEGMGICHSYAPDGRCISLLKIPLTNFCQYDCLYCVNRVSSNVPRALHRRRGGAPDAGLLSPQLHRGPVPVQGHHPQPRLRDGAGGRGGALPARGPRLPRLHPPEDHPDAAPPSALLRMDPTLQPAAFEAFVNDLKAATHRA